MNIPKSLISMLRRVVERNGYLTTPASAEGSVADTIRKLRPYQIDKELIRLGGDRDGGYLVPDDLAGIEYCFSPGVSNTSTFEEALLERGIKSYLADASVEGPPPSLRDCVFEKKFLASYCDDRHMTLESWIERSLPGYKNDLLLQMDIEGGEYPVLLETRPHILQRFRIIIVEFHSIEQLSNKGLAGLLSEAFHKLLRDFTVVHIHPNNVRGVNRVGELLLPNLIEVTFVRNDRIHQKQPATVFPHPLDRKNIEQRNDVTLPKCWYQ